MKRFILTVIIFFLFFVGITNAKESKKPSKSRNFSETITVKAGQPLINIKKDVGFTSVLEMKDVSDTSHETADVLKETAGVTVTRYGGLGMFSTVSIRGSETNQVAYYLNGIPLNSGMTGIISLSTIPLAFLNHIEVYRGWIPAALGQPTIGGAINFVTKSGNEDNSGEFTTSIGSFQTYSATLSWCHSERNKSFFILTNHTESAGNFSYLNNNGTPANFLDDRIVIRSNSSFNNQEGLVSYTQNISNDFALSFIGTINLKDQGLPGTASIQTKEAGLKTSSGMISLKGELSKLFSGKAKFTGILFGFSNKDYFFDPAQEISFQTLNNNSKTRRYGLDLQLHYDFNERHFFSVSLGGSQEENNTYSEIRGIFSEGSLLKKRWLTHFSLDDEYSFFVASHELIIRPSIRLDVAFDKAARFGGNDPFHNDEQSDKIWSFSSPQLALKWKVNDTVIAKGSVGYYSRYPTLFELYGDRGTTVGNADLVPETGINRDIGFFASSSKNTLFSYQLEYAFFVKESNDLLAYVQNSQYTFRPENIGAARTIGHELNFSCNAFQIYKWTFSYTYQNSRDISNIPYYRGNRLPNRPLQEISNTLSTTIKPMTFSWSFIFESLNYLDRANRKEVPERLLHNISITWDNLVKGFRFVVEMRNITNNQISDVAGYPLPGRSYYAALRYNF